jgi:hypothetical protein
MARQTDDVDKASHALLYLGKAHLRLKSLAASVEALTSSIQVFSTVSCVVPPRPVLQHWLRCLGSWQFLLQGCSRGPRALVLSVQGDGVGDGRWVD